MVRLRLLLAAFAVSAAGCDGCGRAAGLLPANGPDALEAELVGTTPSEVTLRWEPHAAAIEYWICRNGSVVGAALASETEWTDTNVASDSEYAYVVEARGLPVLLHLLPSLHARSGEIPARTSAPAPWLREDVASTPSGVRPAVAVAPDDVVHVAYCRQAPFGLLHVTDAGAWGGGLVEDGCWASIAFDPAGTLHALFRRGEALRHATWSGGPWTAEAIDPGPLAALETALAADDAGCLPAACAVRDAGVRYATNRGGAWTTEDIAADARVRALSIAAAPGGAAHVLFFAGDAPRMLRHLSNASGAWAGEDIAADVAGGVASAVDAGGTLHVVAFGAWGGSGRSLLHLVHGPSGWTAEEIHPTRGPPGDVSLAAGPEGALHVSYGALSDDLLYASNAGGTWSPPVYVDVDGNVGARNALAVDGQGRVHIVYLDLTRNAVRRARSP